MGKRLWEFVGCVATVATCDASIRATTHGHDLAAVAWGVAFIVSATLTFRLDWR